MNSLAEAMVKAGIVSQDQALAKAREVALSEELNRESKINERRIQLRRELKRIEREADEATRGWIENQLTDLSTKYSDVFDEVATQEAWKINLHLR